MPPKGRYSRAIELLTVFLKAETPLTFLNLRDKVVDYADHVHKGNEETAKRSFHRDKALLEEIGCQFEVEVSCSGQRDRYRLANRRQMLMPALAIAEGTTEEPAEPPGTRRKVHPEEVRLLRTAVHLVADIGDLHLEAAARRALQKLLPDLSRTDFQGETAIARDVRRKDAGTLLMLVEAREKRKFAQFQYASPWRPSARLRRVNPYGLYRQGGYVYLVAQDRDAGQLRTFRVDRIEGMVVNQARPETPDFEVPIGFSIRDHAVPRLPWQIGDQPATEVIVDLLCANGASLSAVALATPCEGVRSRYAFAVRDAAAFADWILGFAGELRVVGPDDVRRAWQQRAAATLPLYERPPVGAHPASPGAGTRGKRPRKPSTRLMVNAADQLSRMLHLLQLFGDGQPHSVQEIADRIGVSRDMVLYDLDAMRAVRGDVAAHQPELRIWEEDDGRWELDLLFPGLRKPLRLTLYEYAAVDFGLRLLEPTLEEGVRAHWQRLRALLRAFFPEATADTLERTLDTDPRQDPKTVELVRMVLQARRTSRVMTIAYLAATAPAAVTRDVHPYDLHERHGLLYLEAWCTQAGEMRVFRLDRIQSASLTDAAFTRDPSHTTADPLRNGILGNAPAELVVRYSGRGARIEAEYEGVRVASDGSLVSRYPLADEAWGMRKVLQYGPEAEALAPDGIRDGIRTRLQAVLAER